MDCFGSNPVHQNPDSWDVPVVRRGAWNVESPTTCILLDVDFFGFCCRSVGMLGIRQPQIRAWPSTSQSRATSPAASTAALPDAAACLKGGVLLRDLH